jgi:peptidoglycan/LPS O-acetylase OafA/YrhL
VAEPMSATKVCGSKVAEMNGSALFGAFRSKVAQAATPPHSVKSGSSLLKSGNLLLRVTTSGRFRPEIDGLRFFAIIPVLTSHLLEWMFRRQAQSGFDVPSGYLQLVNHLPGVLLFFAISGYILTYQISSASRGGYDWSKYRKYIVRRFKRIAPPYYVLLVATFIVVGIVGFKPEGGGRHFDASHVALLPSLIASFLYSHWLIYGEWPRLFGAAWTLEIETQYYIIAPVLTLIYLDLSNKKLKVAVGIAAITLTSIIASCLDVGNFWAGTIAKFFPYFFAGMLALELQDDLRKFVESVPKAVTNVVTVIAVLLYLRLQAPEDGAGIGMFAYYVVNILSVMMMFIAVSIEGNILRRICVNRYVVIIGGACYSIYLTHGQAIYLVQGLLYKHVVFEQTYLAMIFNLAVEVPIAIVVGLTFYVLIERPFMVWGRDRQRQQPVAAGAATGLS